MAERERFYARMYNNIGGRNVITDRMRRLLWIGMLLVALQARAQFDVAFTNSWALQSWYNPAAAGVYGQLDVHAAYSQQMAGFSGAPATMALTADLPLWFFGPSHGAGVGFMNDKAGLFTTKKIYLQYAYHQKLGKGRLSVGLRPVILTEGFDGSKADTEDSSDPAFATSQVNGTAFDLDAGLRYTYKQVWYAGLSAAHLMGPTIRLGDDKSHELKVDPTFYAMGGYKFRFRNPQYAVATDALLRTDLNEWRADVSARLMYDGAKHKLYGGVMYSPTYSVGVMLGINFHGINIGYSYEVYTGGIGALNGTHEVMLGYQTDLNLFKKGKNLHKSVRLL